MNRFKSKPADETPFGVWDRKLKRWHHLPTLTPKVSSALAAQLNAEENNEPAPAPTDQPELDLFSEVNIGQSQSRLDDIGGASSRRERRRKA